VLMKTVCAAPYLERANSFLLRKEFWAAGSRAGIAKKRRILIL
jgi:hypothetical protein